MWLVLNFFYIDLRIYCDVWLELNFELLPRILCSSYLVPSNYYPFANFKRRLKGGEGKFLTKSRELLTYELYYIMLDIIL